MMTMEWGESSQEQYEVVKFTGYIKSTICHYLQGRDNELYKEVVES